MGGEGGREAGKGAPLGAAEIPSWDVLGPTQALSCEMWPGTAPEKASSAFSVSSTGDKCLQSSERE